MTLMPAIRHSLGVVVLAALTSEMLVVGQGASDEQLIRAARALSNAGIAKHDVAAIARVWMENVHVVSSTGAQTAGRSANQQRFVEQFKNRPDTVYVRTPTMIEIYRAWSVAAERGEWTGRWTEADGSVTIGGTYLAQWRKINGEWLIQGELYVPTHCRGSKYCASHP
jgi:ketosteroid isomerase-like protein